MKTSALFGVGGLFIGLVLGGLIPSQAMPASISTTANETNFCVNKSTKVVTQKAKCLRTERALRISLTGLPGPAGPAGLSGSGGVSLSSFPLLSSQVEIVDAATCQTKWSLLMTQFNIESDSFGQPLRNRPWATGLAGSCVYPSPEIFENPKIISFSEIQVGLRSKLFRTSYNVETDVTITDLYNRATRWQASATLMRVKVALDSGWDLCTSADPQHVAKNLSASQAGWTQTAADEITFSGSGRITWDINSNPTDYGYFASSASGDTSFPYFCGPDPLTPSGLGYRTMSSEIWIPVRLNEVSIAP